MHYLKYIFITILLYVAPTNAIYINNNLEKIDKQQVVTYLKKQPFYERQNIFNFHFFALWGVIQGASSFIDQKKITLPLILLLSFLCSLSRAKHQFREFYICNTYYDDILKYQYLAREIDNDLVDVETFLYHNDYSVTINELSDNIIELFCDWLVLYRRDLRSSFFSAVDLKLEDENFNIIKIINIDVSSSNEIDKYGYLKTINFKLIEKNQTVKTNFLINTLQQNGIHLITNNNHKCVGIINKQDESYLLFGVELNIPKEENLKPIITRLQEKVIGSNYIDPECYALIIRFNPTKITQTIAPFLCKYFGAFTNVDLYEVSLVTSSRLKGDGAS